MRVDSAAFAQKNVELAKDPRYVIELAFDSANTQLWYFTSHSDAALPPSGVSGSILGIVEGLSGTSQTLNPDTANASIGNISFSLVDRLSIVTTTLGGQLVLGRSTRKQRVRVYVGYQGLAWADYTLVQTQLVTGIAFSEGTYKFSCQDIQREMRKDIFTLAKTTLALTLAVDATTVEVADTSGFTTVAHGTSYSDAPSATVGYIRIEDERIRYTGKTSTQFTGCTRGALNTRAVEHQVDQATSADRRTPVTEYVYLEMPTPKLMYALLTGILHNQGGATLPTTWHLGIPTSYVRLVDFTGIGTDLWDPADDQQGFVGRLEDQGKIDGKKFIEMEAALLTGVFMPIYADGAAGVKRMANVLAGAAYVRMLDETNIVSYGDLMHDYGSLHNLLDVAWNWEPLQKEFTRHDILEDAESEAIFKDGDPLKFAFRLLHGSRHSSAMLKLRFDAVRDRFSGPPIRLDVVVMPSLNTLEVGDVVRVRLANVRDYTAPGGGGRIDRSFEIQNVTIDWITGNVKLKLFGSSRAPGPIAPTTDATVLPTGFYTGTGTALSSVLTITGSNPGHISASGNLVGHADMNNAAAIYYYDGDLVIDPGVVVTINNNVQLRIKGFVDRNGKIDGKGRGLAGALAIAGQPASDTQYNAGTVGYIGVTEAGGGLGSNLGLFMVDSFRGGQVVGRNPVAPGLNLVWDGATLDGIPGDMRGSSGSSGMPYHLNPDFTGVIATSAGGRIRWAGGAGGAGGAGLLLICRGTAAGVSGVVDLSGADGALGDFFNNIHSNGAVYRFKAGSGAGGAPGAFTVLLDGAGLTATGLTETGFVALYGKTPVAPIPAGKPSRFEDPTPGPEAPYTHDYYSYFVGTGDGTMTDSGGNLIPIPSLSGSRGGARVQKVPGNPLAAVDPAIADFETLMQELQASNWTERQNPKNKSLQDVVWIGDKYIAVGDFDGATDAYIVTSPDGVTWTERANPKSITLVGVAWNGTLAVAVGLADGGDAYIVTSPDGITWTERANPKNFDLRDVVWAGQLGLWIAVGVPDGTDAYIVTSPDGVAWTERANPNNICALYGVAWNGSMLVAVGLTDGADAYIATSPNGVTWTERANPRMIDLYKVVWAPFGMWVAVGNVGASQAYIVTSPDGITWTERSNPKNITLRALAAGTHIVVASGGSGTQAYTVSSRDGATWVQRENINQSVYALGLAWSGHRFVLVGLADGVDAQLLTSIAR